MSENTPRAGDEPVATGDRRDEVHFEPDPDQQVKAAHLVRPEGPLPPQEHSAAQERQDYPDDPALFDVRVAPPEPSAWDARPADADDEPPAH